MCIIVMAGERWPAGRAGEGQKDGRPSPRLEGQRKPRIWPGQPQQGGHRWGHISPGPRSRRCPLLSQGKAGAALRRQPPCGHCHAPGHGARRPGPLSRGACARPTGPLYTMAQAGSPMGSPLVPWPTAVPPLQRRGHPLKPSSDHAPSACDTWCSRTQTPHPDLTPRSLPSSHAGLLPVPACAQLAPTSVVPCSSLCLGSSSPEVHPAGSLTPSESLLYVVLPGSLSQPPFCTHLTPAQPGALPAPLPPRSTFCFQALTQQTGKCAYLLRLLFSVCFSLPRPRRSLFFNRAISPEPRMVPRT